MSNQISPFLAEIFMTSIEKHQHNVTACFLCWYRYLVDILVCFIDMETQIEQLIN